MSAKLCIWVLRQNLFGFRRGFPWARKEVGFCPEPQLEDRGIWRVHQESARGRWKSINVAACCKAWLPKKSIPANIESFQRSWKKKKNLAFSIDKTKISSQNGISSYSVFRQTALLRCTSSQFLPTLLMLIHHSWAFGKQKREEEQTQHGTSWEESVFAMVLHQSRFRTVSTQRFLWCLQTVTRCPVPYPHFYKRKNSVEEKNKTKQKKSLSHTIAPGAPTLMPWICNRKRAY